MCYDLVCAAAYKYERPLPVFSPRAFFWGERSAVYNISATIRELQNNLGWMEALQIIWFNLPPTPSKQGQLQS